MKLYHVRDLASVQGGQETLDCEVDFHCIVIRRNKTKSRLFVDFQDETGFFQAVVEKESVTPIVWEIVNSLRLGDAVYLQGRTTDRFKSATVAISSVERVENLVPTAQRGRRTMGLGSSVSQAYVARLQKFVRETFERAGYLEVATRLITSIPPPMPGLYPLRILYDGFGAPFHITPSPVPQVIQALASTSYNRVFAVSRCFTQGYRDPVVSVESIVVTGAARKVSIEEQLLWLDNSVRSLLSCPETRSSRTIDWQPTRVVEYDTFEGTASSAVDQPQAQIFLNSGATTQRRIIGRLCWPRHPEMASEFSEHVLAEGYAVGGKDQSAFSVITINVDRLLTLIFEQVDLRRIPALVFGAAAVDSETGQ